ncbi:MAG: hypothetical protein JXR46_15835 [Calditrichaceae bacterium]|nr:hypothetical protein [Calditrichaceae bacterium]MBN2710515.1 hypothetical protein [Calditrichaceae bacterium]RQV97307.1 MAG: hypothetical protein EH224_01820 [Calditrichota bacterium]
MKKFILLLVFSFFASNLFGQTVYLSDDFEDGNLDGWALNAPGEWIVSGTEPINGSYSVQHNVTGDTSNGYMYHDVPGLDVLAGKTTWQVVLKNGNWEPSDLDRFWVYLMISGIEGNGYSVGVNKGNVSDTLQLLRITSGANTGTVLSAPFKWKTGSAVGIVVSREKDGLWSMHIDTTGNLNNFTDCGSAFDDTYTSTSFFAMSFYYTSLSGGSLWMDDVYISQVSGVNLSAKVFLEGPFGTADMSTNLYAQGYIPLSQPYNIAPWNFDCTKTVSSVPENAVDWVLVELRSGTSAASAVAKRAGFLLSDGSIADTSGTQPLFFASPDSGNYYVVIYHRNHLSIMSAAPVRLTLGSGSYDFTTGLDKTYGSGAQKLLTTGIYGMYAGDASANGQIQNDDKNAYWLLQSGSAGYKSADFNLNGQVQNDDKNAYWQVNSGRGTQVPQ